MLRFLADENFHGKLIDGVQRLAPLIDLVRVQDVGLSGVEDPDILEWAAREGRVLLTHDVETIPGFAIERIVANKAMPGVIEVSRDISYAQAIDEIVVIGLCCDANELDQQVWYVPLS